MNTVDTALVKQDDLKELVYWGFVHQEGYPSNAEERQSLVDDAEALISSLTNEAELRGRVDELEQFEPLFKGDHTKCIDPMSCIGYQNAQSDFDNEKQIRLEKLREANI